MNARCTISAAAALGWAVLSAGSAPASEWRQDTFRVSGFIAMEYELRKHTDQDLESLFEINKARFNFDLQMTDAFWILAEYNPVPEELVHHHDVFPLKDGRTLTVERLHPEEEEEEEDEGILPFERLEARWSGIGGRALNLSAGQLRNPFGLWEDFTAHRNSTATKNSAFVLGIALHNVDIGAQIDGTIADRHRFVVGVRNGATVRTQRPRREDDNGSKDLVGKFVTRLGTARVGANAYFVDARTDRWAVGAEYIVPAGDRLTVSGEVVYKRNRPEDLANVATYVQANYNLFSLLEGLRWFALVDYWRLSAGGEFQGRFTTAFTGLKYKVIPGGLTLTAEYGRLDGDPLREESNHQVNLQAEVSF
jgi:hypothetical protein